MNFVSCVKWVKKGVAQNIPEHINLNEEELKNIIEDAGDENEDEKEVNNDKGSNDEYDMKNYDEEDCNVRATLKGMADFSDNSTKKKKKKKNLEKSKKRPNDDNMSDSEKEDEIIKDEDNLLIVGHADNDLSTIDIYVYNESDGDMYIHHDIMLKSPPLCLEWLNVETMSGPNNICAVGTMNPVIELWDLDIVNSVAPVSKLGRSKKKNPDKNFGHIDAVLTAAWNAELPHILFSGSVDKTGLLWDLDTGKVSTEMKVFTDKVQAALWNPQSPYHLLTACADGKVRNFDCRLYDEFQQFDLNGAVESIVWNPTNEYVCYAGTDSGYIYGLDFRSTDPLFTFSAHKQEVTGLNLDRSDSKTLISVSTDEQLKLWNIEESKPKLLYQEDFKLEAIHCIDMNPDYPYLACIGGSSESTNKKLLKIVNLNDCRNPKTFRPIDVVSPMLSTDIPLLEDTKKNVKPKKPKVKNNKSKLKDKMKTKKRKFE